MYERIYDNNNNKKNQFNSIQFIYWSTKHVGIQLCYIKWKVNHIQHGFILFEHLHVSTCIRVHISEVNYVYNL